MINNFTLIVRHIALTLNTNGREPLQDWVDPSTCVLLERQEGSSPNQRPGLSLSVAPGHHLTIAEVVLLSEVSVDHSKGHWTKSA